METEIVVAQWIVSVLLEFELKALVLLFLMVFWETSSLPLIDESQLPFVDESQLLFVVARECCSR